MDDNLMKTFVDPKTGKILLEIIRMKRVTVKALCERFMDIPRSTMYRILTKMEREGYIEVIDYRQIRGVVEKTYAPSESLIKMMDCPDKEPSLSSLVEMFISYMVDYLNIFRRFEDDNKGMPVDELKKIIWGFYTAPVYVNNNDLEHMIKDIGFILSRYTKENWAEGRTLRSIGTIVSPPVKSV